MLRCVARAGRAVTLLNAAHRRRKDTLLDGKPLISLPEKEVVMDTLEFPPEELDVYNVFQAKMQAKISKFIKKGTVMKQFRHIFVLLLRLRQACACAR
jgi:SNF2 family DNA or RNA helicase